MKYSEGYELESRYVLKRFLGAGSFGEVWLARDSVTQLDVVLKIYANLDSEGLRLFQHEYSASYALSHTNLLRANHLGVVGNTAYLVLPYCANGSSRRLVGHIDEPRLWKFIDDVAAGLAYLHGRPSPVIHQDIKPDNVLIDGDGRFLLSDFGISVEMRSTLGTATQSMLSSGSIPYMAPERFLAHPQLAAASDIWSLGVTIYYLATGELPFCGNGGGMQLRGAQLPELPARWSRRLDNLVRACLAEKPADRPTANDILRGNYGVAAPRPRPAYDGDDATRRASFVPPKSAADATRLASAAAEPARPRRNYTAIYLVVAVVVTAAVAVLIYFSATSPSGRSNYSTADSDSVALVNAGIVVETDKAKPVEEVVEDDSPEAQLQRSIVKYHSMKGYRVRFPSCMQYSYTDSEGNAVFVSDFGARLEVGLHPGLSKGDLWSWAYENYGTDKPSYQFDKGDVLCISDYTDKGQIYYVRGVERPEGLYTSTLYFPRNLRKSFEPWVKTIMNQFPDY